MVRYIRRYSRYSHLYIAASLDLNTIPVSSKTGVQMGTSWLKFSWDTTGIILAAWGKEAMTEVMHLQVCVCCLFLKIPVLRFYPVLGCFWKYS